MSNDIYDDGKLLVTAFVGEGGDSSVQFGTQGAYKYAQLTREQCLKLAHALLARVTRQEGYRATD